MVFYLFSLVTRISYLVLQNNNLVTRVPTGLPKEDKGDMSTEMTRYQTMYFVTKAEMEKGGSRRAVSCTKETLRNLV